ncbi:GGDEF domain-containing protein [Rhodoferax sp. 4810]|nr:GGDEF domain-containing protein [Rhodoferax jenense]
MQKLLQGLAHLSGLKDRQVMDLTLVTLIGQSELWRFKAVRLLRAVGPPDDQHWVTLGQWDSQHTAPARDEFWFDLSTLPRLEDYAHREAAIVTESVIRTGTTPFTTIFPIDTQATVCSVLEVESDAAVPASTEAQIDSILHLYENLQGLLDYGERDSLTDLLNRKTFDSAFLHAAQAQNQKPTLDRPDRRGQQAHASYWLAVMDIDHFKHVNDNFGHLIGDEVLLLLARLMRASYRFHDQLYRFGGEEFVVLMRCTSHDDALGALERFRRQVEQHAFPQVGHITISIGFAPLRADDTPTGAFDRADKAVYSAKSHGRNRICSFTSLVASGELVEQADDLQDVDFF